MAIRKDEIAMSTTELRDAEDVEKEEQLGLPASEMGETLDAELEPEDSPKRKERWWSPKWHLLQLDRFVTSYMLSPKALFIYRLIVFLYMTAVVIGQGIKNQFNEGETFKYFTWMSFFSLYFYFAAATIHTGVHAFKGRPILLEKSPKFLNCLYWLLYELMCTYHIIVPAIYWVLLSSDAPDPKEDPVGFWINVSVHGLDAVFIVVDAFLGRNVMLISHILFMVVFALCYCAYAWIWYAFGYALPYDFLNIWWYYILLPVVFIIIYFIMFFAHLGREKAFAKRYARKMEALQSGYGDA